MTHNGMSPLVGLDLNANRARAVTGPAGYAPTTLALDGAHAELPLALSLEKRTAEVGRAGLALCRRLPHLACLHFLAQVGEAKQWKVGRHKLDAAKALTHVFERIRPYLAGTQGLVLSVPGYLSRTQVALLATLAEKVRLPLLGTLPSPLALALAAYTQKRWTGLALVADVDDHGLTWSAVLGADERARVLSTHTFPHLSLRSVKERLLNLAADRCVRQSRRDPRESGAAEQMLYEELDNVLEAGRQGRMAELVVQADHWCQNLFFRPEELTACCNPLLRAALETVNICLAGAEMHGPPST